MNAVLFQSYETSKSIICSLKDKDKDSCTYLELYISGCIAGAVSCIITSPTELFKLKVQEKTCTESATINQEWKEAVLLYKNYGFRHGIYRGFLVTIYRDSPSLALYFLSYEWMMNTYDANRRTQIVPFISGGIAGLLSWSFAYPMDHVKTYYQLHKYEYGNLPLQAAIRDHIKREGGGVRTLYRGLGATLLRCVPQHAVVFACYENMKRLLEKSEIDTNNEQNVYSDSKYDIM